MENYKDNGQHKRWIIGEVQKAWFRMLKWEPKALHGNGVTLTLNDGSEAIGHYLIVESGAVTPCCYPFGQWCTSKGFPKAITHERREESFWYALPHTGCS